MDPYIKKKEEEREKTRDKINQIIKTKVVKISTIKVSNICCFLKLRRYLKNLSSLKWDQLINANIVISKCVKEWPETTKKKVYNDFRRLKLKLGVF